MFELNKSLQRLTVSGNYNAAETNIVISSSNLISKLPLSGSGFCSAVWYNSTDYPSVYNDPNKEIIRITGFSGQTLFVNRGREYTNQAIHSGNGKTHKMIITPSARGFNNLYYFRNPEKSYFVFEDFLHPLGDAEGWDDVSPGTTSSRTEPYSFNQQLGVHRLTSLNGDSNANRRSIEFGADCYFFGSGLMVFEIMFKCENIPSTDNSIGYSWGFNDSSSIDPVDGAVIHISSGSPNFRGCVSNNSVRQFVDLGVQLDSGWHKGNIVIEATGGAAHFYIDDIYGGGITGGLPITLTRISDIKLTVARVSTLPSTTGNKPTGYIDYVLVYKEFEAGDSSYQATGYNFRL